MKKATCGRCGQLREVKRELWGSLGQIIIICQQCRAEVDAEAVPFWEWMHLPMRSVEAEWQAAVLQAVK